MKDLSQKNNSEETSGSNYAIAAVPISIVLPQDVDPTPDTVSFLLFFLKFLVYIIVYACDYY